ncbi:SH3 domain-containing protein [Fontimonas thermophila]|uniref:SH3 domain-containing protein n=1 Tax=Fontimonas thermophila TaxID=1076937 RepID=A0A1I2H259_9GAMM|nr:SH3 domain-containing protein [Fontimonas thermophila]SFF22896.1 SH3 domain-containing protein [Fontimonas thermophila]
MYKALAAGLLSGAAAAALAAPSPPLDALATFLRGVQGGMPLQVQRYTAQLPRIGRDDGTRSVTPTLELVAGRLDAEYCLYQLRLQLRWSGRLPEDKSRVGGRSLIQKAPCATLPEEVLALVQYELSALQQRVQGSGRLALRHERDQVIATVRHAGPPDAHTYAAVTVDDRVNVRASPERTAPVLATLPPGTQVRVVPAQAEGWYRLLDVPGHVHASTLRLVEPAPTVASPPQAIAEAVVGRAPLLVHAAPARGSRVVGRLAPGTAVRLRSAPVSGWFALEEGTGFVPEAGVRRAAPALTAGTGTARSAP